MPLRDPPLQLLEIGKAADTRQPLPRGEQVPRLLHILGAAANVVRQQPVGEDNRGELVAVGLLLVSFQCSHVASYCLFAGATPFPLSAFGVHMYIYICMWLFLVEILR